MYKRFVNVLYALNIIAQAAITLLIPAALMFGVSWLLVEKLSAPKWLYAVLITVGVISGLISMIRFVIRAAEGLERMENQRNNDRRNGKDTK